MTKKDVNILTYKVLGAAIEVHKILGPGLLESVYHRCLKQELNLRNISFQSELIIPVNYKSVELIAELRCDFLVENALVIELKAIEAIAPVHEAQVFTYMKLLNIPKGILLNFHSANLFKDGQKTFVNEIFRALKDE